VSKSRERKSPAAAPAAPMPAFPQPFGYDPKGPTEPRDIVSTKEGWSEFTLADGSVIRAKAVLLDVKIASGQYSPDGDPIYLMQLAFVNQLKVPESLKKKD
jgi:hypothetical protein